VTVLSFIPSDNNTTYRYPYVKVKVKFSLCLTKHHPTKTYWGVEV